MMADLRPAASPVRVADRSARLAVRQYTLAGAEQLRQELDGLNSRSSRPCPFSTCAFFERIVEHDESLPAGAHAEVVLLVATEGSRPVGFLPLRRTPRRLFGIREHQLELLVRHEGDRPHVVAAPEDETRCAEAFVETLAGMPGWSLLNFPTQESTSALGPAVRRMPPARFDVRRTAGNPNCTIYMEWPDLDSYFRACPKSFRQSVARRCRHLLAAGGVEWIRSTDAASGRALYEVFLELERRSWKHGTDAAIQRDPRRVELYRSLLDDGLPMHVKVNLLVLDGVAVGGQISGHFAGNVYGLETVYAQALHASSPGNLTHLLMMHDCLRESAHCYNLKVLFAYHKESWLARTTETEVIQVFRRASLHYVRRRLGDWSRRRRGAPTAPPDHNADKRAAVETSNDGAAESRVERGESNTSRALLEAAIAAGIVVDRISDAAVRAVVPWKQ
jgi:hypothetical protein